MMSFLSGTPCILFLRRRSLELPLCLDATRVMTKPIKVFVLPRDNDRICVESGWNKCHCLSFLPEASFGLRVLSLPASVCVCVCLSVCPSVCQSLACPRDNSGPVQARIAKFRPKMQKTLVKVPIVLGGNWPWPSRSNLTSKSEFTPFWACLDHYSPPILVRISEFGQQMYFSTVKIPVNSGLDWPWTSPSFSNSKTFFTLWRCALRLWNSPWFVSMLSRDCVTVSTPVHMGNAQPKWNGASSAVVLNLN